MTQHSVLIVGGGTAGISVAARLRRHDPALEITLIEPSEFHYYQPLWSLVGAGVFAKERTRRPQSDCIPPGVEWLKTRVVRFEPAEHALLTADGQWHSYEQLIVAVGIQLDWHKIEGLPPISSGVMGADTGICSNYSYETVDSTWQALQAFSEGNALFTLPATPVKCAGAPQKIMYLTDDYLRLRGMRERARIWYAASSASIFGVEKYARTLRQVVERKHIQTLFRHHLVRVDVAERKATFQHLDSGEQRTLDYNLLHVTPPQSAPDVIKQSPLANPDGWVEVDKHSLQHKRFPDVFALGDASSLPTSRTGAAVRRQAPVLVENLLAHRARQRLQASYSGYSSCPLITGYGRLVLAEFDYDGQPMESFPIDQARERYSMYLFKAYALPALYWRAILRGRL
ncbi:MAG TPA: FAD/NAD(P)-binding oxidoreductase [Polyangiaceae bacterium]|nr:FAD/NAD(P)-binding oxidoreductase [Polyangiaceae bacterium]